MHESTSSSYDITKSNKLTVEVKKEDSGSGGTETPENPDTEKPETPEGNGGQDTKDVYKRQILQSIRHFR